MVSNLTRQPQRARFTLNWDKLQMTGAPRVTEAFAKQAVSAGSPSITVGVEPLGSRLLRVQ